MVPYAVWLEGLDPGGDGRRAAVRGSLVFGTVYFGVLLHWMPLALGWYTPWAVVAWVGTLVLLVGLAALVGWVLHRAVHRARAPLAVALPVVWTAGEWLRAHLPGPLAFPWLGLGTSLTGFPELVGFAEIVGARGVTFWVVLLNALVASVLVARNEGRAWRSLATTLALVLLVPTSWSLWRARTLEVHPVATVAVVQPSVPQHLKLDPSAGLDSTLASLDRLFPGLQPGSVALTVLPEMTLPARTPLEGTSPEARRLQALAREVGGSILFGALGAGESGNGGVALYNSAFLMEPQGLATYRYDKRFLVPVAERSTLLPEAWLRRLPVRGGFGVGEGWPLAEVDGVLYGVLVCYESAYPQGARSFRNAGADVLVNITNDAWFGREPWWSRTTALWQHPSHLVMRAIENRVGVVRAANTGISLFVDPVGRVRGALPLFRPGILTDTVYTTGGVTFYTRHGDWVGAGAVAAALILVLAAAFGTSDGVRGRLSGPE